VARLPGRQVRRLHRVQARRARQARDHEKKRLYRDAGGGPGVQAAGAGPATDLAGHRPDEGRGRRRDRPRDGDHERGGAEAVRGVRVCQGQAPPHVLPEWKRRIQAQAFHS